MSAIKRRNTSNRGGRKKKPENILKLASVIVAAKSAPGISKKEKMIKPKTLIGKFANDEWDRVVKLLEQRGISSPMYVTTLTAYCNSWAIMQEAAEELVKLKRKYVDKTKDGNTTYQTQWMSIYNKAEEKAYRYSALFGFSPCDDTRMKALGSPEAPRKNDFDGM